MAADLEIAAAAATFVVVDALEDAANDPAKSTTAASTPPSIALLMESIPFVLDFLLGDGVRVDTSDVFEAVRSSDRKNCDVLSCAVRDTWLRW